MFHIRIAELTVKVDNRCDYVKALCADYFSDCTCADITVSVSDEELTAQTAAQPELKGSEGESEALCVYRNIGMRLPFFEAFIAHGVALEMDGASYVFLAKSGVGKTTHALMWFRAFRDRVQVINGDKPIIRRFGGRWYACGTPWCGKEMLNLNTRAPIRALCFIERGEENTIRRAQKQEILERLFAQILFPRDKEGLEALINLLDDLLRQIPCYILKCRKDPDAAITAYQGMKTGSTNFEVRG